GRAVDFGTFFSHRIARVLPLHFVVLSAMALGFAAMLHMGITPESEEFFSWSSLPYHYALINVWFGISGWNGPTWSLNSEFAAYLLFPAMLWVSRRCGMPALLFIGLIFVIADFCLFQIVGFKATGLAAIARGVFGFGAGMMLCLATRNLT